MASFQPLQSQSQLVQELHELLAYINSGHNQGIMNRALRRKKRGGCGGQYSTWTGEDARSHLAQIMHSIVAHSRLAILSTNALSRRQTDEPRFINLCNEDALFGTEIPGTDIPLPFDDADWAQGVGSVGLWISYQTLTSESGCPPGISLHIEHLFGHHHGQIRSRVSSVIPHRPCTSTCFRSSGRSAIPRK